LLALLFSASAAGQTAGEAVVADAPAGSALAVDPAYADARQAFDAVFIRSGLGWRGYVENREYAAAIYLMPDGRWHATRPVRGGLTRSTIPYGEVPPDALQIVGAHTHGQPHIAGDSSHLYGTDFSEADRRAAIHNYQATRGRISSQLLLTSRLEILQMDLSRGYDPGSGSIQVIARTSTVGYASPSREVLATSDFGNNVIEPTPGD
jgi:hypothetical protein